MKVLISVIMSIILNLMFVSGVNAQSNTRPYYDIYNTNIISKNGEYYLTEGDFNKDLMFGEFVLGRGLDSSEKLDAYNECLKNFNENPLLKLQSINFVTQTMSQVYSLTDALQVALVRNNLIGEVYNMYNNTIESSVLYDLILKYIHIVDFDPLTKLVLTEENINGLFSIYSFSAQVSNQIYNPSPSELERTKKEILKIFRNGTLDQKQYLCVTESYNYLFRANYQAMMENNQEQLMNPYLSQYSETPYQNNNTNTVNAYKMLSNLSLQNHAAMLNSIEAIGGSDDYWYVK